MSCWDCYENKNPAVGECSGCGYPVDSDGDTTLDLCTYSPTICYECGYAPCDGSC